MCVSWPGTCPLLSILLSLYKRNGHVMSKRDVAVSRTKCLPRVFRTCINHVTGANQTLRIWPAPLWGVTSSAETVVHHKKIVLQNLVNVFAGLPLTWFPFKMFVLCDLMDFCSAPGLNFVISYSLLWSAGEASQPATEADWTTGQSGGLVLGLAVNRTPWKLWRRGGLRRTLATFSTCCRAGSGASPLTHSAPPRGTQEIFPAQCNNTSPLSDRGSQLLRLEHAPFCFKTFSLCTFIALS